VTAEEEALPVAEEETVIKAEEPTETIEAHVTAEEEALPVAEEEAVMKAEEPTETAEAQATAEEEALPVAEEEAVIKAEEPTETVEAQEQVEEAITEEAPEQPSPEEKPDKKEPIPATLELDREAPYEGEVEIAIAVPVDPAAVSTLYNHLQMTPEIKILYTRGSWDRGTTITVTIDKPLPLIDVISRIPSINITAAPPTKNNPGKGATSGLLGSKGKKTTRVDLMLQSK